MGAADAELIERLERYAALAAHQLGEAVALVRAGGGALADDPRRADPAVGGALRALGVGADRAQRFVEDLLDLAAAAHAVEEAACSLDEALDRAAAVLATDLERAGARIVREPLPSAAVGAEAGRRLFVHLLRGALAAGARTIEVRGGSDGAAATLVVRDDGAPDRCAEALEPLGRPRGRGALVGAGVSGLIARRTVEVHGGAITAAPGDDERATATITLPTAPSEATRAARAAVR